MNPSQNRTPGAPQVPSASGRGPGPDQSRRTILAGRYELGERLGTGAMSSVYAATDHRLQRPVAVKILKQDQAEQPDLRARFQTEARWAARLSHPSAVAVYDTGEHDGVPFLVMERLPGETLASRIAAGSVDTYWLTSVAAGIAGALAAAHSAGIVHRDIKPGNILITGDGRAKIADFGIAKSLGLDGDERIDLTRTGQLIGTPSYLAPERLEGSTATPRSDIYSLGVVLYEALSRRKPFVGTNPLAVAFAIKHDRPVPLGELRPDLDDRLVAMVERAMAREPAQRFASATEMAAQLSAMSSPPRLHKSEATQVLGLPLAAETVTAPLLDNTALSAGPAADTAGLAPTRGGADGLGPAYPDHGPGPVNRKPSPNLGADTSVSEPVIVGKRRRLGSWLLLLLAVAGLASLAGVSLTRRHASSGPGPTVPSSPQQAEVAARLRDVADRVEVGDGPRGPEAASRLRAVAAAALRGGGGQDATALLRDLRTWNATGGLYDTATKLAVDALLQVPGVEPSAAAAPAAVPGPRLAPTSPRSAPRRASPATTGPDRVPPVAPPTATGPAPTPASTTPTTSTISPPTSAQGETNYERGSPRQPSGSVPNQGEGGPSGTTTGESGQDQSG